MTTPEIKMDNLYCEERSFSSGHCDIYLHLKSSNIQIGHITISDFHLSCFNIKQEYRNKGYGSWLLRYCINKIKKQGQDKVTLDVECNNIKAQRLYNRFGFETEDKSGEWYYHLKLDLKKQPQTKVA